MTASAKIAAVNNLLDAVYGPDTQLSKLLIAQGHSREQLAILRDRHLVQLVEAFVASIADRFAEYDAGDRKYQVLARRFVWVKTSCSRTTCRHNPRAVGAYPGYWV